MEAGRDYLRALETLGLRPSCLFWAWDQTVGSFVLVLVVQAFDHAGPLALSRTLFKAYNHAGTPREIDPFIVRLHSPQQAIVHELAKFLPFKAEMVTVKGPDGKVIGGVGGLQSAQMTSLKVNANDLEVHSDWVVRFEKPTKMSTLEVNRRWRRFVGNVEKLAA